MVWTGGSSRRFCTCVASQPVARPTAMPPAATKRNCRLAWPNEKLPVKGKVTHNERGTYLVKQKESRKPKEVDVAWLKEFVETKK